jgi:hypothetical protein
MSTPQFLAGQSLVLLPSLKAALAAQPSLVTSLSRALKYQMPPEKLPACLGYPLSLAAIKLASVKADQTINTLAARNFCCADLAQLRVEVNGIRALAIGNIAMTEIQDAQISALLNSHFDELGMRLHRLGAAQYVLELPADVQGPTALAPSELIGSAISGQLPEPARWRMLLNESQMLLAQTPMPSANSLWFYGAEKPKQSAGNLVPVKLTAPSNDPLLLGLQTLSQASTSSQSLAIFDYRSPQAAQQALPSKPLWLSFDSSELFYVDRFDSLKFWRKKRAFDGERGHAPL